MCPFVCLLQLDPTRGSRDSTEVRIRRTIGLKKDQYLVNDQPYSNADFQNLLESAGLSRSNPYYIVEQGKIAKLMKQAKSERLELLKEIAGTRTYDDRKKESLKIMKETDTKLKQIDGVISGLEEKLNDLEKESKEFKKFLVSHETHTHTSTHGAHMCVIACSSIDLRRVVFVCACVLMCAYLCLALVSLCLFVCCSESRHDSSFPRVQHLRA